MALKMYEEEKTHSLSSVNHIIAVAAGKGGVGKSSVSVNLSLALKKQGFSVGLLDSDIYGPSVCRMLKQDRLPVMKSGYLEPGLAYGIKTLSMSHFKKEASVVRAPIANGLISQFIEKTLWGSLDFLIIDFPPGTGDVQLTLAQKALLSGAIMVTTPPEVSLMDVRKAANLFSQVNIPILGVVENMSYYKDALGKTISLFGKGGGEKLAQELRVPLLSQIPIDPLICQCLDQGISIFENGESPIASSIFLKLAESLVSIVKEMKNDQSAQEFELLWERS